MVTRCGYLDGEVLAKVTGVPEVRGCTLQEWIWGLHDRTPGKGE